MTTQREITNLITRESARGLYSAVRAVTEGLGYCVAMYGSTVFGTGRDLDIVAVPWRADADQAALAEVLGQVGEVRGPVAVDESGFDQYEVISHHGYSIDVHVHRWGVERGAGSSAAGEAASADDPVGERQGRQPAPLSTLRQAERVIELMMVDVIKHGLEVLQPETWGVLLAYDPDAVKKAHERIDAERLRLRP